MFAKIIGASAATGAGIAVVSMAGKYVDENDDGKRFSLDGERFDQGTFMGRWKKMISNFDPATLLYSDSEIKKYVEILKLYDQEQKINPALLVDAKRSKELWHARKVKESAVHPDTGEIVPRPFRMAGYVPFNGPVCVAMMVSTTTPALLFWNWVNQSQNACVNYFNRNASASIPSANVTKEEAEANEQKANMNLAKSYATAVSAALFVAFGVSQFIIRKFPGDKGKKLLQFVALPSSCIASSSNAYIMRKPEISTGISLVDADGKEVGPVGARSKVAATKAVQETVMSRVILQFPVFFLPPVLLAIPPFSTIAATSSVAGLSVMAFLTTVAFGLGLPGAVAYFPQIGTLTADEVEPEFKEAALKAPGQKLYYNKGL